MPKGKFESYEAEEEIAFDVSDLKLTLKVDIYEDEAATVPATRIIWGTEKYFVRPHWKLEGKLAKHITGEWKVKIDLESVGVAKEYTSEVRTIAMDPCKEDEYSTTFVLGPNDLDPHEAGTVYMPAVTLTTLDPCGGDGHMWGYFVGPSVMFIRAKPNS